MVGVGVVSEGAELVLDVVVVLAERDGRRAEMGSGGRRRSGGEEGGGIGRVGGRGRLGFGPFHPARERASGGLGAQKKGGLRCRVRPSKKDVQVVGSRQ